MSDKVDLGIQPALANQVQRTLAWLLPDRCDDCGTNWADLPSKPCPGCEAYREHTGAI